MFVEVDSQLQLGADTVGARDQHWLFIVFRQLKQATETTETAHHAGAIGAGYAGFDFFDELVAGVNIDTRIAVT